MTCIVGLVDADGVHLGADSAGVGGMDLVVRRDPKIVRNGDFIFGFTSSFRMGQLLAYSFQPPRRHPDDDLMAYMVCDFITALRDCFKAGGVAKREGEVESCGTFLVGVDGRLFNVADDYQVGESAHGFDACGCGAQIALGALHATPRLEPRQRLETALQAAESFSAGVRGPFMFDVIRVAA